MTNNRIYQASIPDNKITSAVYLQFLDKLFANGVRGNTKPIDKDALFSTFGLNGVDYRFIVGVAIAFKAMHLRDLEFGGLQRLGNFLAADAVLIQVEVNCITSFF